MLDDSRDVVERGRHCLGRLHMAKGTVQNKVAVIGDDIAPLRLCAEILDAASRRLPAERDHFDRDWPGAQTADELGLVDDHQEPGAGLGDDLRELMLRRGL